MGPAGQHEGVLQLVRVDAVGRVEAPAHRPQPPGRAGVPIPRPDGLVPQDPAGPLHRQGRAQHVPVQRPGQFGAGVRPLLDEAYPAVVRQEVRGRTVRRVQGEAPAHRQPFEEAAVLRVEVSQPGLDQRPQPRGRRERAHQAPQAALRHQGPVPHRTVHQFAQVSRSSAAGPVQHAHRSALDGPAQHPLDQIGHHRLGQRPQMDAVQCKVRPDGRTRGIGGGHQGHPAGAQPGAEQPGRRPVQVVGVVQEQHGSLPGGRPGAAQRGRGAVGAGPQQVGQGAERHRAGRGGGRDAQLRMTSAAGQLRALVRQSAAAGAACSGHQHTGAARVAQRAGRLVQLRVAAEQGPGALGPEPAGRTRCLHRGASCTSRVASCTSAVP